MTPRAVTIANTGDLLTIPPDTLFTRFQKGDAQIGGLGLGLAIARQIADVYGLGLIYSYAAGQHQFSLTSGNSTISP